MLRKNAHLTALQVRKQLLLAESEINRIELVRELNRVKGEISHLKKQVRAIGSIASSAALAATAFSIFRRRKASSEDSNGGGKPSWLATALAGARIGTSLFLKIKSMIREHERE